MINFIINFISNKEIILYEKHRQTMPLVSNTFNRKRFWFIPIGIIWKYIPFKTTDKRKHKIMYFILNCVQPKYILSMNWISKRESLYKVWTTKNTNSKFMVVQHGVYTGGIVRDIPHKYIKSDIFLTWGSFFVEQFKAYNSLKKVEIVNFGNSIYNTFNRKEFEYRKYNSDKVLLLPTALDEKDILLFYNLIDRLKDLNFLLVVKPHNKQGKEKDEKDNLKYPNIEGVNIITGDLYSILQNNEFDFIVSDHSSSLLDAIFFKNKVIYFDPNNSINGYTTQYSKYLANLYSQDYSKLDRGFFEGFINIENQEALLSEMVRIGNNQIDSYLS
ncbi:hypothetical protein [Gelidibacter japonicus]|uniref:hypothetical protein n=1 Tax=Gelidibacter japonicus TaxID=1962232 RepID=UPI002AFEE120|nr:hypothetical protein [Gelidibacter japonicus]